jgi:hypothetical protein
MRSTRTLLCLCCLFVIDSPVKHGAQSIVVHGTVIVLIANGTDAVLASDGGAEIANPVHLANMQVCKIFKLNNNSAMAVAGDLGAVTPDGNWIWRMQDVAHSLTEQLPSRVDHVSSVSDIWVKLMKSTLSEKVSPNDLAIIQAKYGGLENAVFVTSTPQHKIEYTIVNLTLERTPYGESVVDSLVKAGPPSNPQAHDMFVGGTGATFIRPYFNGTTLRSKHDALFLRSLTYHLTAPAMVAAGRHLAQVAIEESSGQLADPVHEIHITNTGQFVWGQSDACKASP